MKKSIGYKKSLFFIFLVLLALIWLTPIKQVLSHWDWVSDYLHALGIAGYFVFVIVTALLCMLGVPRLLAYAIAGMAFGFYWGLLLAQTGVLLGNYGTFILVRFFSPDFWFRRFPKIKGWLNQVEAHSIISILLIRQLPVPNFLANIILSLSAVRKRDFLIASFIGFLPEGIPVTLVGAGLATGNVAHIIHNCIAAVALIVLTWLFTSRFYYVKQIKKNSSFKSLY